MARHIEINTTRERVICYVLLAILGVAIVTSGFLILYLHLRIMRILQDYDRLRLVVGKLVKGDSNIR